MKIIGRRKEIEQLDFWIKPPKRFNQKQEDHARLIKVSGRRRVGKSFLIENYIVNQAGIYFKFIGNNSFSSQENLKNNLLYLKSYIQKFSLKHNNIKARNWNEFLLCLNEIIELNDHTFFIFFDEVAWLSGKQEFIRAFENIWNMFLVNRKNTYIFLASSVTSWLDENLDLEGSLYNRIDLSLELKPFSFKEIEEYIAEKESFFNKKVPKQDLIKYYMMFGGIIKYYDMFLDVTKTFQENLQNIFNNPSLQDEKRVLFQSLFRKNLNSVKNPYYEEVLFLLCAMKSGNFKQIYEKTSKPAENEIRRVLNNLEKNHLILTTEQENEDKIYMIADIFTYFIYFWKDREYSDHFYSSWKGTAFELFVLNNLNLILEDQYKIYLNWKTKEMQIDLIAEGKHKYVIETKMYENGFELTQDYLRKFYKKLDSYDENAEGLFIVFNGLKETNYNHINIMDL